MKKKLMCIKFLGMISIIHLTSCSSMQPLNAGAYSKHVQKIKPSHTGNFETTRSGIYIVKVYPDSVVFTSLNQVVSPSLIEVFDLDSDRRFDTVFVYTKGSWLFGTTNEFSGRYSTEKQNLDSKAALAWASKASRVKRYFIKSKTTSSSPLAPMTEKKKTLPVTKETTRWSPQ